MPAVKSEFMIAITQLAAEKNLPWGKRLSTPLGIVLIGWGCAIVVMHVLPASVVVPAG